MTIPEHTRCPNCGRGFNCDGSAECWCLKVDRDFDYEAMIIRTRANGCGCVCPVCLTGRSDLAGVTQSPRPQRPERKS